MSLQPRSPAGSSLYVEGLLCLSTKGILWPCSAHLWAVKSALAEILSKEGRELEPLSWKLLRHILLRIVNGIQLQLTIVITPASTDNLSAFYFPYVTPLLPHHLSWGHVPHKLLLLLLGYFSCV